MGQCRRATVPARRPCAPQEAQNKRSSTMSKTGRASTTRSHRPSAGSMTRWPVARRPRGSRPSRASGSIGSKRALARARAVAFNIASGSSGRRWIVQRHPSSPPGPRRPLSTPARPPPPPTPYKPEEPDQPLGLDAVNCQLLRWHRRISNEEGMAIMQVTVKTVSDHRVRTVQTAMSNALGFGAQVDMLAPGGSTSSSAGSCCSCSTCAVVAQPHG